MLDRSKLESLRDVSVTRIGDTLSCGFPQTEKIRKRELFNTYSRKQPDLYYFETIKMTSQA